MKLRKENISASAVKGVAFSSDGNVLVSGSSDKKLRVWDVLSVNESEWEEVAEGTMMTEYGVPAPFKHWRNSVSGKREEDRPCRESIGG